ncbi:hypothetical protein C1645_825392, partial [Glomus cerebriforme]
GANIVVVKIKNSEQIVGGYNPFFWDSSNTNKSTKDSFIFSFTDKNDPQSAKVVHSLGDQYSIQCLSGHGPVFSSDLHKNYSNSNNEYWQSWVGSYPTLNLPSEIYVDDYEVFQVIKK